MTPLQMHIEVNQGLQQVAANKTFKFLSEEIDLVLNKMQTRLIQMQLTERKDERGKPAGGFEVAQTGADIIRPLIISSYDLVPYIVDERMYHCYLPPDYAYLLSDWSYTNLTCGTRETISSDTMYITQLRQNLSDKQASPYYVDLKTVLGNTAVNIPGDLMADNNYAGLIKKEQIYELVQFIARKGNWYWERFGGANYPGFYINTSLDPSSQTGAMAIIDGTTTQDVKQSQITLTSHRSMKGKYYDNRLTASDNISGLNPVEFYRSSHYSPISELSAGFLNIYRQENFTVTKAGISYIRKADPISISLNTKSELPEEFHYLICDLAVEYIKGRLENFQGWKQTKEDNDSRVLI